MAGIKKTCVAIVTKKECVACGSCVSVCSKDAIYVHRGIHASIKGNLCVGCGKCSKICPASAINIKERM